MNRLLLFVVVASCLVWAGPTAYAQGGSPRKPPAKAKPCRSTIKAIAQCPDEGCGAGVDANLNRQKNIHPNAQEPVLRSIAWMKDLEEPRSFTPKNLKRDVLRQIGEGQQITVVAWALAARKGGQESCNCKLKAKADTDNHIVLVDPALKNPTLVENEKHDSETAEFTPRVRADQHPDFTQENLESQIDPDWSPGDTPTKGKLLVRVTGVLMFDSEHFLRNHLKRHNNWEIHPVLKVQYCPEGETCEPDSDDNWVDLESEPPEEGVPR